MQVNALLLAPVVLTAGQLLVIVRSRFSARALSPSPMQKAAQGGLHRKMLVLSRLEEVGCALLLSFREN